MSEILEDIVVDVSKMETTTPTREKSSAVGNAAAMREAVEAVVKVGYPHNFQKESPHIRGYCHEITTAIKKCFDALSAPQRNCDVLSKDEVLETLKDRSFSKEDTIEWLYGKE